ncbi:CarD family transcriptional regulator [Pseudomonadota bacterium]
MDTVENVEEKGSLITKYKPGDKLHYPGRGVVEVVEIEERDLAGTGMALLYRIRVCATDFKILVPIDNVEKMGIRPIISESDVVRVFTVLKEQKVFDRTKGLVLKDYSRLKEMLGSSSILEVANLVGELMTLRVNGALSFKGNQILETALGFVAKEVAEVTEKTEEQVTAEIKAVFDFH